jgi:hypothetical protein
VGVVDIAATRSGDFFMDAVAHGVQRVGEAAAVLLDDGG